MPRVVVPFLKVTLPVGVEVFPAGPETVAVKVTLSPAVIPVEEVASAVEDADRASNVMPSVLQQDSVADQDVWR